MAVQSSEQDDKITLILDNGDKEKFHEVMEKYNFKDHQSLLRFAIAIMLETKENTLGILKDDGLLKVTPSASYLNK